MTKQRIAVSRIPNSSKTKVSLSFEFPQDDPRADLLFTGIGKLLKEYLTPDEQKEFVQKLEAVRKKSAKGARQ